MSGLVSFADRTLRTMLHIDGSMGEGGGQILRSSLGLSMVSGKPFRIGKMRENRDKPGLMRQHLTAVNAAATVCGATVDGAAQPRELQPLLPATPAMTAYSSG